MQVPRRPLPLCLALASLLAPGCAGDDSAAADSPPPLTCPAGSEPAPGDAPGCVDSARRYEPAAPLDMNNVVDYGHALQQLQLPPPPHSGFRIVVPPVVLMPGEERLYCVSWPIPPTANHVVYAGRLYSTEGLHHSNVIAKPVKADLGKNPYPDCNPGAADPFSDLPDIIPDVLFGNTTQIVGTETLAFPPGMGYPLDPAREISGEIHLLNATAQPLPVEIAYDFFTMPAAMLQQEVAPFELGILGFLLHPGDRQTISATCDVYGGNLVSLMLHTHKLAQATRVERLRAGEDPLTVYQEGAADATSRIRVYDPQIELTSLDALRYSCDFYNSTDHDVHYGLGDNEMCVLFGYVTPPDKQFIGYSQDVSQPCQTILLGAFRK